MNNRFEKKKKQLESLEHGKGLKHILMEGYKVLENPALIFDTSYNLLIYVEGIVTDDWLWNEIIALGTFSHKAVDFFNQENFIEASAKADTVALMKSDKLKYDRLNGKIFDKDDVQIANIIFVASMKSFEAGDAELIELLCDIISIEIQNSEFYQRIDRVYQESVFDHLIDGEILSNDKFKIQMEELGKELKPHIYLAVVDITQYDHTVTHLAYFRDLFKKMQAEHKYYIHMNYIVILISKDDSKLNIKRDFSRLNPFFIKYNIYAGISSCFNHLLGLRKHYREAVRALNYGLKNGGKKHIFKYDPTLK